VRPAGITRRPRPLAVSHGDRPRGTSHHSRTVIRDTALQLFAVNGPDAVTIRDVAGKTGIPPALIVRHYQPRDGLRDPVDDHVRRNLEVVLAETAPGPAAAPSALAAPAGLAGAVIRHLRAGSEVPACSHGC
jgi:hypothetical protein